MRLATKLITLEIFRGGETRNHLYHLVSLRNPSSTGEMETTSTVTCNPQTKFSSGRHPHDGRDSHFARALVPSCLSWVGNRSLAFSKR